MRMFSERIRDETPELRDEGVRMRFIGRRDGISAGAAASRWTGPSSETAGGERITLFVAFNYGGRAEILDAAERYQGGGEEAFRALLYAPEMHDPDLVIRTSGEQRLSNYLLWQSAYSELVFSDELWPDFSREALRRSRSSEFAAPRAPLRWPRVSGRSRREHARRAEPTREPSAGTRTARRDATSARTSARACSRRCRWSCSRSRSWRSAAAGVRGRRCSCSA